MSKVSDRPIWCDDRSTIPRLLVERAERWGAKPLIGFSGEAPAITYEGLVIGAEAASAALVRHGCRPAEMAALCLPNGPEFVFAWFACLFAGLVDAPINPDFRKSMLLFALDTAGASVLFSDGKGIEALLDAEVAPALARLSVIVVTREVDRVALLRRLAELSVTPRLLGLDEIMDERPPDRVWEAVRGSQPASVRYTSGTTGTAKGVIQSHLHILNKSYVHNQVMDMGEDDVLYSPFPLHHNLASINGLISTIQAGGTMGSAIRFSASRYWVDAHACGATRGHILYPLLPMLLAQPVGEADRRHRVRYLWMAWPHREFEERFATTLVQIYALGEIGVVSYRRGGTEVGATGQVLPEMEVRIVDEVDRPVAHGDVGEITVRPRQPHRVMLGYLNNLPATMRAFRNLWFHTGDYGHVAEDGELYFQGRIGDTIRRRGVNISSEQIESEALRHPNVRECAVIGVPSVLGEEDIHACLVWRETPADIDAAVADLLRFLQERLPRSYVPRYIELAHELPKTNTGKVRKTELRDRPATGRCWDRETTRWLGEVG